MKPRRWNKAWNVRGVSLVGLAMLVLTGAPIAQAQEKKRLVMVQETKAPVKEGFSSLREAELLQFPELLEIEYTEEGKTKSLSINADRLISITFTHDENKTPKTIVVARSREAKLPPVSVTGTVKVLKDGKLKVRFAADQADARDLAAHSEVQSIVFTEQLRDGAAGVVEKPVTPPKKEEEEDQADNMHALYFNQGIRYAAVNNFGDGPYMSTSRYAVISPGMTLKVAPDGGWSVQYQVLAMGGAAQVDWELKIRFVDEFGKVCEIPLQTPPRHIIHAKDARKDDTLVQSSGRHPAIQQHFHSIVASGAPVRRGHVLFVSDQE